MYISSYVHLIILIALLHAYATYLPGFQIFSLILHFLPLLILNNIMYGHLPSIIFFPAILRMGQNVFLKDTIFYFKKNYKREAKLNFSLFSVIIVLFANE